MEKIVRDTNTDLMNKVFDLVQKNGCYEKANAIMDYFLPEDYEVRKLTDYGFDFLTRLNFGCEGIYLDCYLEGIFREDNTEGKTERLSCGTFKTLKDDLEAMKIMGELAGSLTFFARQYINGEITKYTPAKDLERQRAAKKNKTEETVE